MKWTRGLLKKLSNTHRLDQTIHRTGREPLDIGLLNDRRHRLLRRPARLQEFGEVAALAQLGDLHIDPPGTRLPRSGPISVAMVHPVAAALVNAGAAERVDVQRHETVGDEAEHLGQKLGVGRLRQKCAQGRSL